MNLRFLRKAHVLPRVHLEIEGQRIGRIGLDRFLHEFHENRIFSKDRVFIHRFEIDGDEERPRQFRVDPFAALDAEDLLDFQQLHAGIHHHLLDPCGSDLWPKLVEHNVVNHGG